MPFGETTLPVDLQLLIDALPVERQSWKIHLMPMARAICEAPRTTLAFDRKAFAADPRLSGFVWVR